ncbi:ribulose-phosphate 3-epimerase, partial [Burkholderia pseudomallei]|nr:ribulose-phosphate 3-epimerase [Burkholderia pseudomallei]
IVGSAIVGKLDYRQVIGEMRDALAAVKRA